MSFDTVQTSLLAVIRTHADFDATNVQAGEASAMKRGLARTVRILKGAHTQKQLTIMAYRHTWSINIDLYVPWKGSIATLESDLYTEGQKIIDTLHQYPYLNASAGVTSAEIINAGQPEALAGDRKGRYRGQRYILEVVEVVTPGRLE